MNRASFVGIIALTGCILVAGCAQQQANKMEIALTPYVAKSIADYALDPGPPTGTIDMGAGKHGFQWVVAFVIDRDGNF